MAVQLQRTQWDKALGLHPDVGPRAYAFVWWMKYYGAVVRVSEGLRSAQRQRALYAQGRTAPGPIVTNTRVSRHQSGRAFDIDFVGLHPDSVPQAWWAFAGRLGEALGLRWGGRWRMRDYRHFEFP